jgi:hypothetical protein
MLRILSCGSMVLALAMAPAFSWAEDAVKKDEAKKDEAKQADAKDQPAEGKKKAEGDKPAKEKKPKAEKPAGQKKMKSVGGAVKAVDANAKTITITKQNKKQQTSEDKTLTLADDVKVTIQGEAKTVPDVATGASAKLTLSEDGQKVIAITVGGAKKEKKDKQDKKPEEKKPAA